MSDVCSIPTLYLNLKGYDQGDGPKVKKRKSPTDRSSQLITQNKRRRKLVYDEYNKREVDNTVNETESDTYEPESPDLKEPIFCLPPDEHTYAYFPDLPDNETCARTVPLDKENLLRSQASTISAL